MRDGPQNFSTGKRGQLSIDIMARDEATGRVETYAKFTGAKSSEGNLTGHLLKNGRFNLEGTIAQVIGGISLNRVAVTMQGRLEGDTISGNYFVGMYIAPETQQMLQSINSSFVEQMRRNSTQRGQFSIATVK